MKPGATTRLVASMRRPACSGSGEPGSTIRSRSPSTTTLPARPGVPVPSTIVPPVISRSALSVTNGPSNPRTLQSPAAPDPDPRGDVHVRTISEGDELVVLVACHPVRQSVLDAGFIGHGLPATHREWPGPAVLRRYGPGVHKQRQVPRRPEVGTDHTIDSRISDGYVRSGTRRSWEPRSEVPIAARDWRSGA